MPARLSIRLLCLLYEILILIGLGMVSSLPFVYLTQYPTHPELRPWYRGYLLCVFAVYFVYQWHQSGQTVPMKTWRLKIVDEKTLLPIHYGQALRRFVLACLLMLTGISFLWLIIDSQRRWLHDRLSGTLTLERQS